MSQLPNRLILNSYSHKSMHNYNYALHRTYQLTLSALLIIITSDIMLCS